MSETFGAGFGSKGKCRAGAQQVPTQFEVSEALDEKGIHYYAWNESKRDDDLEEGVGIYYHGTSAHDLPYIMADGFRPSIGEGSDQIMEHYGLLAPGT